MANLSQQKRERMMEFLSKLKEEHKEDDSVLIALGEIEAELNAKKYGLVWEEHEENVDVMMKDNIPVFTECKDKEITASDSTAYNFLLEGDNLHSLYLLEKTHKGKIDIIYIDPPYNTGGTEFRYDDAIVVKEDGFKHSKWLSFMKRRLVIARKLMSDDGIIFISIDDNEVAPAIMLCNEIFGEENHVETIIWKNKYGAGAKTVGFISVHEYILCYSKKPISDLTSELSEDGQAAYKKRDEKFEMRGGYLTQPLMTTSLGDRPNLMYTIEYAPYAYQLKEAIRKQMQPASCVLIMAGVYSTYSKWINIEIELAKSMNKKIIAIEPWGSEKTSRTVKDAADVIVGWNTDSIVNAIRG